MTVGWNWVSFARFLAQLHQIALAWYREVAGDNPQGDDRRIAKAVSRVIDPDTPETDVSEVNTEEV